MPKKSADIEIMNTDISTLLNFLSGRLRNDGLALLGLAAEHYRPDEQEYRDLDALKESLERVADLLDASGARLCNECRMVTVSETVTFQASPKEGESRKGGRPRMPRKA